MATTANQRRPRGLGASSTTHLQDGNDNSSSSQKYGKYNKQVGATAAKQIAMAVVVAASCALVIFGMTGGDGAVGGGDSSISAVVSEETLAAIAARRKGVEKQARRYAVRNYNAADLIHGQNYGTAHLVGTQLISINESLFPKANGAAAMKGGYGGVVHYPTLDLRTHVGKEEMAPSEREKRDKGKTFEAGEYPRAEITEIVLSGYPLDFDKNHAILTRCGFTDGEESLKEDNADSFANKLAPVLNKEGDSVIPWETISQVNQDRGLILDYADGDTLLMAVFDGHGERGHASSHYAVLDLPRVLASNLRGKPIGSPAYNPENARNALIKTMMEMDRDEQLMFQEHGGTTASMLLKSGGRIFVANVGDSRTFVARYHKDSKKTEIVYQTTMDKPNVPVERKRLEGLGATVFEKEGHDGAKTLTWMAKFTDERSGKEFETEVSRSLGDRHWKPHGMIGMPTVDIINVADLKLSDNDELFAIIVTDGILDNIPEEEVVRHLAASLYRSPKDYRESGFKVPSPLRACEELVRKSSIMWESRGIDYRNDMTIGVSKIVV